jgi:hypothetical protein
VREREAGVKRTKTDSGPASLPCKPSKLSLLLTFPRTALGANFPQFKERGATNMEYLRATSDEEMGKTGPCPAGCGANRAMRRSRPRRWTRHSLRARPRLARFSLATPPARKLITGFRTWAPSLGPRSMAILHPCSPSATKAKRPLRELQTALRISEKQVSTFPATPPRPS